MIAFVSAAVGREAKLWARFAALARTRSSALLLLAPPATAIVYVAIFATATPLTDEWVMLGAALDLHKHGWSIDTLRSIQMQVAQHLVIVPYLIYFPLERLFHYDTRALIAVTLLCFAVQLLIFRFRLVRNDFAAFPIALLLFSPSHFMEFHWGWLFTFTLSVTLSMVALVVLDRIEGDNTRRYIRPYIIGSTLLVCSTLSSAPGYFGFLSASVLVALKPLPARTKAMLCFSWMLIAAIIYFGVSSPQPATYSIGTREVLYVLTALGSVIWGSWGGTAFGVGRDSLTGLVLILALILILARAWPRFAPLALPIVLITLGLSSIGAAAVSRPYLGNWHLQFLLPAVCGIYAAAYIAWQQDRSWFGAALPAVLAFLLLLNFEGYRRGFTEFGPDYRDYVGKIENYILSYTPTLEKPFPHCDREINAEMIEFLREQHHPLLESH